MKKPTNRDGFSATAVATESASPGRLAINAALSRPWRSSSATHLAPSASTESGNSHPRLVMASRVAPRPAKKPGENKWTCASFNVPVMLWPDTDGSSPSRHKTK